MLTEIEYEYILDFSRKKTAQQTVFIVLCNTGNVLHFCNVNE